MATGTDSEPDLKTDVSQEGVRVSVACRDQMEPPHSDKVGGRIFLLGYNIHPGVPDRPPLRGGAPEV